MRIFEMDEAEPLALRQAAHHANHHARHLLSRRAFLGGSAALTAAAVGAGLLRPMAAMATPPYGGLPTPTTNIFTVGGVDFHLTAFGPGIDPSSISNFNGFVGVADVQGSGTAINPDGSTEQLLFDTDMRFMSGVYVGVDGKVHKGTFGFV
jgi:hypothetical protein